METLIIMELAKKQEVISSLRKSENRMALLANSTSAERSATQILKKLGFEVINQQPIYTGARTYYLDIYIPKLKLSVEIDGGYHYTATQKRKDENRSQGIRRLGIGVCRLSNHDARDSKKVKAKIMAYIRRKSKE